MRAGRLCKMTGFWKGLFFMGNQRKMSKALIKHLREEGVGCRLENDVIIFEFGDCNFVVAFILHEDCAECVMSYSCGEDKYEALDMPDKTFIADNANVENENHCVAVAYNDVLVVRTSFYFTSKRMMLGLFSRHFEELIESVRTALGLVYEKISRQKAYKNRTIGFNAVPVTPPSTQTDCIKSLRR